MKDYYNLFIKLAERQCSIDDYSNKENVKEHNSAMKELMQLQKEMGANKECCSAVLASLLDHENEKVRLNAAVQCLQTNQYRDKAIEVLKLIAQNTKDKTIQFSAKMALQDRIKTNY